MPQPLRPYLSRKDQLSSERETFWVKERPSGGFALLVYVRGFVLPIGVRRKRIMGGDGMGEDEVVGVKIREWSSEGISWDFVEV